MLTALIIVSILLVLATAFIFWLLGVLKNTLDILLEAQEILAGRTPQSYKQAYDGKYYPATVISKVIFNSQCQQVITDFSMYEEKKVVGFYLYTPESPEEYLGIPEDEELEDEIRDALGGPTIFKNVIVYAPKEGMWTWKSAE